MVLFVFQFYPVCNFGQFINFRLVTVRSERVKLFPIYNHHTVVIIFSYHVPCVIQGIHQTLADWEKQQLEISPAVFMVLLLKSIMNLNNYGRDFIVNIELRYI